MSWQIIVGALGGLAALLFAFFKGHSLGVRKGTSDTLQVALQQRRADDARDEEVKAKETEIALEVRARQLDPPSLPSEADLDRLHEEVKKL